MQVDAPLATWTGNHLLQLVKLWSRAAEYLICQRGERPHGPLCTCKDLQVTYSGVCRADRMKSRETRWITFEGLRGESCAAERTEDEGVGNFRRNPLAFDQ